MSLHRLVEEFAARSVQCRTSKDLLALTQDAGGALGFDRLAMVHPLWFRRPSSRLIRLDTFGEFGDLFIAEDFYRDDPALLACQRMSTAFRWSDMPRLIRITRKGRAIIDEAGRHGLRQGLTLPIGVPGEPAGCCSFVSSAAELPSRWHCRAAAFIAAEAFRDARRLHGLPAFGTTLPTLSPRKLEILQLAAMGKTDPEIAIILGLRRSTIETYMTQLRTAFGVYSRTQLCVQALRFGLIAFEDAMPGF